jgi:hypothetical protein
MSGNNNNNNNNNPISTLLSPKGSRANANHLSTKAAASVLYSDELPNITERSISFSASVDTSDSNSVRNVSFC